MPSFHVILESFEKVYMFFPPNNIGHNFILIIHGCRQSMMLARLRFKISNLPSPARLGGSKRCGSVSSDEMKYCMLTMLCLEMLVHVFKLDCTCTLF